MSIRDMVLDTLASMVAFGRVVASKVTGDTKTVTVDVEGNVGPSGTKERRSSQQLWGHPAVMYRPKSDGVSFEVVFVRQGEQAIPVAAREVRWQIDLAEGDVVLRNLDGDNPCRLHLLANGDALLEANTIKIGDAGATEAIGLGTAIKGHLDALDSHLQSVELSLKTHVHPGVTTGPGSTLVSPGLSALPSPPSVPDVESRHKVEN